MTVLVTHKHRMSEKATEYEEINLCIDLLMHNMVYEMSNTPSRLPVGVTQAENLSDGG